MSLPICDHLLPKAVGKLQGEGDHARMVATWLCQVKNRVLGGSDIWQLRASDLKCPEIPKSRVIIGDAETCLKRLPEESVHAIVTSPPYWFLRDYGVEPPADKSSNRSEVIASNFSIGERWELLLQIFGEFSKKPTDDTTCPF